MDPNHAQTPGGASSDYELLTPIGYSNSTKCGYCGARGQSFSYYATANSLSPQLYQTLLDRCWRRSGKLMYRPNQRKSCCPHYTIRLDSTQFHPSRDQRQAVNRFNKHVLGDSYVKEAARLYPRSRAETKKRDNEFCLTERVHEAEFDRLKTPPEPDHKLVITLEEDDFTEEKYRVYNNYQRVVHDDPPEDRTRRAFERFLCTSPLKRQVVVGPDGRKRRLGSYHQCYRIDGDLVAIGVLDLLPECVSSVYFLYHESIHKFAPGKLGALHEIALAVEEGCRWWYPGFYIHRCPKMRYKIDYMPQFILDPDTLSWYPLDQNMLNALDQPSYVRLSTFRQEGIVGDSKQDAMDKRDALDHTSPPASREDEPISSDEGQGDEEMDVDGPAGEGSDDDYGSLFRSRMPGIPSLSQMKNVDLDHIALRIFSNGPLFETSDLVGWRSGSISDLSGIKPTVAEFAAVLGPDLMDLICLDLVRHKG